MQPIYFLKLLVQFCNVNNHIQFLFSGSTYLNWEKKPQNLARGRQSRQLHIYKLRFSMQHSGLAYTEGLFHKDM